ncbi:50S ribosomal protein L11 methyltransferase [Kutzneria kofuensis]|uniref:50S ribosomal protein L11 methyltransferase n=1 Tax=Kutzneria kofuensis TaxID=103725 RepID=UPI0031E5128D
MEAFVRQHTTARTTEFVPEVVLRVAEDVTPLWELTGASEPPFWAFPLGRRPGRGRYVLDNPHVVAGKRVFDLACGSGLVAIAAALAGAATVTACDVDEMALVAARINAEANGVSLAPLVADVLATTVDAPRWCWPGTCSTTRTWPPRWSRSCTGPPRTARWCWWAIRAGRTCRRTGSSGSPRTRCRCRGHWKA